MSIGEGFIGNKKTVGHLNRVLEKKIISHAYMFDGLEHLGKTRLALDFAAFLLKDSLDLVKNNPDLIFVGMENDKEEIVADSIRDLQKNLSLFPYKSEFKVAIIDKAHLMSRTAANSILKILEEPSKTSILILLSSDSDKVLETIKSRCQIFNFSPVSAEEMSFLISDNKYAEEILKISCGRPGMAIDLLEDVEMLKNILDFKNNLLTISSGKPDAFSRIKESEKLLSLEKEEIKMILNIFIFVLREELLRAIGDNKCIDEIGRIRDNVECVVSTIKNINNNVNLKLAIENLYLNL